MDAMCIALSMPYGLPNCPLGGPPPRWPVLVNALRTGMAGVPDHATDLPLADATAMCMPGCMVHHAAKLDGSIWWVGGRGRGFVW